MRAILEWLKPGARVKRYIFLQIVSVAVFIFCLVSLRTVTDMSLKTLIAYIAIITISLFGAVFSFIFAQKNILYVSLKNISNRSKNIKVRKMLYGDPKLNKGSKIVVIGGGSGLPYLLNSLKEYTQNITAIVNVSEDDVSISTAIVDKEELATGDIRKCIAALSTSSSDVSKLLMHKSDKGDGKNYSVGNVIISSLIEITGSFSKAIEKISEIFKIQGNILPVTTDNIILCAKLEDGEVVVGKQNITSRVKEQKGKIKQIFLKEGSVKAIPEVIEAINSANVIVIGPGQLYTSVLSNFLIDDVSKAIIKSKAKKVYIANIMNQPGQTYGYTLAKYLNEVERYIGKHVIDYAIANDGAVTEEMLKDFNQVESSQVKIDLENIQNRAICVLKEDLILTSKDSIIHNADRLAEIIMSIAKSRKIGNLNIVKMRKKHIRKERIKKFKMTAKKIVKDKEEQNSQVLDKNKKSKKNNKKQEVKVSEKTNKTVDKIRKSVKKG